MANNTLAIATVGIIMAQKATNSIISHPSHWLFLRVDSQTYVVQPPPNSTALVFLAGHWGCQRQPNIWPGQQQLFKSAQHSLNGETTPPQKDT